MSDVKWYSACDWGEVDARSSTTLIDNPAFAKMLLDAAGTLIITSRNDSILTCLSAVDGRVEMTTVKFPGPMGVAYSNRRLAIGCAFDIRTFVDLAGEHEDTAKFLSVGIHIVGAVSVHDIGWSHEGIWFVNTLFSSVCRVESGIGFRTQWRPSFIRDLGPVDACHLNGAVVEEGRVRYATALAATGAAAEWRELVPDHGILISGSGEIVCSELSLPHSPLILDNSVYFLEAGRGQLIRFDGEKAVLGKVDGVARGLAVTQAHFFVGRSRIRPSSAHVTSILRARFSQSLPPAVVGFARDGSGMTSIELPGLSEISSVHLIPKRQVRFFQPDMRQRAETFVLTETP